MRTINEVQRRIEENPLCPESRVLSALIASLKSDSPFEVKELYTLEEQFFDIAMSILRDWRLDRYCFGNAKLFDHSSSSQGAGFPPKW
jgi:hypothetical protein